MDSPATRFERLNRMSRHALDPQKKVAIIGFASSSRTLAPFSDPEFEIWGLNSLYPYLPRWNRWFEIHPRHHIAKDLNRGELQQLGLQHESWLKAQPGPLLEDGSPNPKFCPIYMQEHYADIPASVRWPREEINAWTLKTFGPDAETDYFTSTPGEMFVQALYEGFGEIHLYGVDLLQDEEYAYQRPGLEYWIGIARGMGVRVYVPPQSALLKASYVYGYREPPTEFGTLNQVVEFFRETKSAELEKAKHEIAAISNALEGARQAFELIQQKCGAGLGPEQLDALLRAQLEDVGGKLKIGKENLLKIAGQQEYNSYVASVIGHYGRGGKLESLGYEQPGPVSGSTDGAVRIVAPKNPTLRPIESPE